MSQPVMNTAVLRALLLGALGFPLQACSAADSGHVAGKASRGPDAAGETGGSAGAPGGSHGPTGGSASGSDSGHDGSNDDMRLTSTCTSPTPYQGDGTGVYQCAEGYLHRAEARECPSKLPRNVVVEAPGSADGGIPDGGLEKDECSRDTDCPAKNSFCQLTYSTDTPCVYDGTPSRLCVQGCRVDADCASDEVCLCGEDIGMCTQVSAIAACRTDADCESGGMCLQNARTSDMGPPVFACPLPGDECSKNDDCGGAPLYCAITETGRTCRVGGACGRPFLVADLARIAPAVRSDGWLSKSGAVPVSTVTSPELAIRLRDHWTNVGLMEHASVAAFARFTLQLLALGAPADLVQAAVRAQADETRHATLAFGLAASYGGALVGPGPLDLASALADTSPESVLRTTILEGCIGETRAALEAAEVAREASVPSLRSALERIAEDEGSHAALAWQVVQWILGEHPALTAVAREVFAQGTASAAVPHQAAAADAEAAAHGLLDTVTLARVHRDATRDVILPCASALLGESKRHAPRPLAMSRYVVA